MGHRHPPTFTQLKIGAQAVGALAIGACLGRAHPPESNRFARFFGQAIFSGYTQWVRNAIASGTVSLKRGRQGEDFGLRLLSDDEKPEILKSYLDSYKLTVQRYFPVPAGSPTEAFLPLTGDYPVFQLLSAGGDVILHSKDS